MAHPAGELESCLVAPVFREAAVLAPGEGGLVVSQRFKVDLAGGLGALGLENISAKAGALAELELGFVNQLGQARIAHGRSHLKGLDRFFELLLRFERPAPPDQRPSNLLIVRPPSAMLANELQTDWIDALEVPSLRESLEQPHASPIGFAKVRIPGVRDDLVKHSNGLLKLPLLNQNLTPGKVALNGGAHVAMG
jgi:hypothetical protein